MPQKSILSPVQAVQVAVWCGRASLRYRRCKDPVSEARTHNHIWGLADRVPDEDAFYRGVVRGLGHEAALELGFDPEFVADAV